MLIKFLEHGKTREDGKNSARAAANYLVDELDHAGNKRAEVNVLRGDENTFTAICDNSLICGNIQVPLLVLHQLTSRPLTKFKMF